MTCVVRFAPSPTGPLHIGSAITALANRAFGDAHGGRMILRIDDTDHERSDERWTAGILDGLDWLGVGWDGEPVRQSQRSERYAERLDALLARGAAYPCFCSAERLDALREQQVATGQPPRYDGTCRHLDADERAARAAREPHVVRIAVPSGEWGFGDLVHGTVAAPEGSFGDFVVRRSDGTCTYLFCSIVDDVDLGVTHVLRGEDHLPNTPRQLAIAAALGERAPRFGHLPLLRAADGSKLSKRDPLATLDTVMDAGFLPETVRRYAAELLGQGAVDPLAADAAPFDLARVPTGAPKLDAARLHSLGREDLAGLHADAVAAALGEQGVQVVARELPLVAELAGESATLGEVVGGLEQVRRPPSVSAHDLDEVARSAIEAAAGILDTTADTWVDDVLAAVRASAAAAGAPPGAALRALRTTLTGTTSGPRLGAILQALGRDEAARRLRHVRA